MTSPNIEDNVCIPLQVGQSFSRTVSFCAASIRQFATLVGDLNPLHHDKEAAEKSRFGGLVASGTHTSSVLSAMVASKLCSLRPSIGLEISFRFLRPVYADLEMVTRWELTTLEANERLRGDIVTFSGQLLTSDATLLVSGIAVSLVQWDEADTKPGTLFK